ncbi:U-box domain-containing protein [Vigna angularis]|uniref:RING-type E3 ubiquitin transferase n=1 Tax=Phaseolus angularis TaxID=3914 RepID=A0A8T0JHK1_PHAAN|nr:U-box domain-containing protein [Vigna angularis]
MMPATPPQINPTNKLRHIGVPGIITSRREIISEPSPSMVNDTICVVVAKNVKDSKLNLIWAIQNSGGSRICILDVHVPAPMTKFATWVCTCNLGAKFPESALRKQEVQDYHEGKEELYICQRMGVRAGKLLIEMDCVEKGIVELIHQYGIQRLVMGAASDKYHASQINIVNEELQLALDQKLSLENRIASSGLIIKELEQRNISADEVSQKYKDELHDLQMQLENALSMRHIKRFFQILGYFAGMMQDPQVAADGFTYEADAIREWLKSGVTLHQGQTLEASTSQPLSSPCNPGLASKSLILQASHFSL